MRSAPCAIGPASASMACSLRWADSEKFSLMRVMRSTGGIVPDDPSPLTRGSHTKRAGQPFDALLGAAYEHYVEAAGRLRLVAGEVVARRANDATTLGGGDACRGAAECFRGAG